MSESFQGRDYNQRNSSFTPLTVPVLQELGSTAYPSPSLEVLSLPRVRAEGKESGDGIHNLGSQAISAVAGDTRTLTSLGDDGKPNLPDEEEKSTKSKVRNTLSI